MINKKQSVDSDIIKQCAIININNKSVIPVIDKKDRFIIFMLNIASIFMTNLLTNCHANRICFIL